MSVHLVYGVKTSAVNPYRMSGVNLVLCERYDACNLGLFYESEEDSGKKPNKINQSQVSRLTALHIKFRFNQIHAKNVIYGIVWLFVWQCTFGIINVILLTPPNTGIHRLLVFSYIG